MFGFNGGAARLGNKEYDSGNPRHGLFAVTAEGNAVQLTNDSDIEPNNLDSWIYGGGVLHGMQWAACDGVANGKVSYLAVRWESEAIAEYGIYVLELDPDNLASHTAVPADFLVTGRPGRWSSTDRRTGRSSSTSGDRVVPTEILLLRFFSPKRRRRF